MLPRQTLKGISEIRHAENMMNSIIKREKIDGYPSLWICGCSNCCGSASIIEHKPAPPEVQKLLDKWAKRAR